MIDYYASGVLNQDEHYMLVRGIDKYAADAGIQPHWIAKSAKDALSPAELEYYLAFRRHRKEGDTGGLVYTAQSGLTSVVSHFSLIAGLLTRNFIRARVMPLGEVLDRIHEMDMPEYDCVLIPNFHVAALGGSSLQGWRVARLYDYLLSRRLPGQQTILYISSPTAMAKAYGVAMADFVSANFIEVGA